jgi:hypothetical protein
MTLKKVLTYFCHLALSFFLQVLMTAKLTCPSILFSLTSDAYGIKALADGLVNTNQQNLFCSSFAHPAIQAVVKQLHL